MFDDEIAESLAAYAECAAAPAAAAAKEAKIGEDMDRLTLRMGEF